MARQSKGPTDRPGPFRLGVIMLKTRFSRLVGDIGNPATFPFETLTREVEAATVASVVTDEQISPEVERGILAAAADLERAGASLITTSCGFLGGLQENLQRAVEVPVIASSLALLPTLRADYGPGRPIGILTFDSRRLSPRHFGPWHDPDTVIEGVETGSELHRVVSQDLPHMDRARACQDVVESALRLVRRRPETAALLMECTNFSPYRAEVAEATGLAVADLTQAVAWHARRAGAQEYL